MTELKHGFGAAKMNKDADERTVPNGEYRDALNVQIVTSDGSDVGTLQTLLGNTLISSSTLQATLSPQAKCVGSIADEANNNIYYFVKDSNNYTDYIFQYDIDGGVLKPIVVDKWRVDVTTSLNYSGNNNRIFAISTQGQPVSNNVTNVRPGMSVVGNFLPSTLVTLASKIKVIFMKYLGSDWEVYMDDFSNANIFFGSSLSTIAGTNLTLIADKALDFRGNLITGINVLDNTIYWTDGHNEPKKVNINNVETDASGLYHTKFVVRDNYNNTVTHSGFNKIDFRENPDYLKEEHLTIIKKSPLYPPTLLLSNTANFRFDSGSVSNLNSSASICFVDDNDVTLPVGSIINISFISNPDYQVGDLILLSRSNDFSDSEDLSGYEAIVEILEFHNAPQAKIKITYVSSIGPDSTSSLTTSSGHTFGNPEVFYSTLKQEKPLYEFKFPRFAYRYKYQDDQYSCYSPFSEVAFLPGSFDYKPKDGYNLGMVNTLRSLYVMDFLPDKNTLPKDVVAIDIVYKESNTNNIYVVETIEYGEDEWDARGSDINTSASIYARTKGALLITSEMVKAAVASNQLLRPWDNVPKKAKAQDMVGNRIVYANYTQNYNLN